MHTPLTEERWKQLLTTAESGLADVKTSVASLLADYKAKRDAYLPYLGEVKGKARTDKESEGRT